MDIVPTLMAMKYDNYDLLASTTVIEEPYESMVVVGGGLILHIPRDWAHVLDKFKLLGLINMLYFWWLNEENTCVKQLLACFHAGILWLDKPFVVIVALISEITGLPKDGSDPSQYFIGRDNEKRLAITLNKRYGL